MQEPRTLSGRRKRITSGGVGPQNNVCLLHNFPPSHLVGPAHIWQMVPQKSGDLCFMVYDKANFLNVFFKTVKHETIDV